MIYTCTAPRCGLLFESGTDHLPEPCPSCWGAGGRTDAFGNTHQLPSPERQPTTQETA